ncbi:MAG: flagellar biosynthetic protein FliO [Cyanobacteria bacterium HKST-UBA03]|nr:flagellar biosynthetic protein FliO [Cyanobacteria bacterium HKST-UBA03]
MTVFLACIGPAAPTAVAQQQAPLPTAPGSVSVPQATSSTGLTGSTGRTVLPIPKQPIARHPVVTSVSTTATSPSPVTAPSTASSKVQLVQNAMNSTTATIMVGQSTLPSTSAAVVPKPAKPMPQKRLAPTKRGTPSAAPQGLQGPQDEQPIAFIDETSTETAPDLSPNALEAQTKLYLDDETEQQQQSAQNKPFDLYGYLLKVVVVLLVLLGGLYLVASMVIKRRQQQGGTASIPQATSDTPASPHFPDLAAMPGNTLHPAWMGSLARFGPDRIIHPDEGKDGPPTRQRPNLLVRCFKLLGSIFPHPTGQRTRGIGLSAQLPQVPQMPGPEAVDVPMSVIKRYALSDTHQIVVVEVAGERMLLGVTPQTITPLKQITALKALAQNKQPDGTVGDGTPVEAQEVQFYESVLAARQTGHLEPTPTPAPAAKPTEPTRPIAELAEPLEKRLIPPTTPTTKQDLTPPRASVGVKPSGMATNKGSSKPGTITSGQLDETLYQKYLDDLDMDEDVPQLTPASSLPLDPLKAGGKKRIVSGMSSKVVKHLADYEETLEQQPGTGS